MVEEENAEGAPSLFPMRWAVGNGGWARKSCTPLSVRKAVPATSISVFRLHPHQGHARRRGCRRPVAAVARVWAAVWGVELRWEMTSTSSSRSLRPRRDITANAALKGWEGEVGWA